MTVTQKELQLTGWFKAFYGPVGQVPVQFFAMLITGEYVYFRARGRKASLKITHHPSDQAPLRHFKRFVRIDHPMRAGIMESEACAEMIKHWLGSYFRQLEHQRSDLPRRQSHLPRERSNLLRQRRCTQRQRTVDRARARAQVRDQRALGSWV